MSMLLHTFSTTQFAKKCNLKFSSYSNVNHATRKSVTCIQGSPIEDNIVVAIAQNKVLIAAAVSAAIGQLSKPFTSTLIYSNPFDFKSVVQPGGLPSTHSSTAVATATSLGLERGFSDSIFGLSVVYAVLIMYDAQGVRRAVGTHAKTINRLMLHEIVSMEDGEDTIDSDHGGRSASAGNVGSLGSTLGSGECVDTLREQSRVGLSLDSNVRKVKSEAKLPIVRNVIKGREVKKGSMESYIPLNERVGHTEVEVIVGALLGFIVSLTMYTIL